MNTEQRKTNEKYFLSMMKITNQYTWADQMEIYDIVNGKMKPRTLRGYEALKKIVTPEFMFYYVKFTLTDEEFERKNRELDVLMKNFNPLTATQIKKIAKKSGKRI
jgi:hypothetical protein